MVTVKAPQIAAAERLHVYVLTFCCNAYIFPRNIYGEIYIYWANELIHQNCLILLNGKK